MKCRAVKPRLVAYQDRELSPAEALRVREHLARCPSCADHERRLAEVTPRPFLEADPAQEAMLWARLDAAVQAELDRPPRVREPGRVERAARWLSAETRLPTGAVLGYAALLLLAIGWGATNWRAASSLQAALDRTERAATASVPSAVDVSADQYRPAAYQPDERADAP